jgi:hypothetical protein
MATGVFSSHLKSSRAERGGAGGDDLEPTASAAGPRVARNDSGTRAAWHSRSRFRISICSVLSARDISTPHDPGWGG